MSFVLWVCRAMHIFGVVVWLGGLMFQNAIVQPVMKFEGLEESASIRKVHRRFTGFIWMSIWTVFVTGIILMLLSPRFLWFQYNDLWSIALGVKQLIFLGMVVYAFGHARMLAVIDDAAANGGSGETMNMASARANQFRKISIFLGIIALVLASSLK